MRTHDDSLQASPALEVARAARDDFSQAIAHFSDALSDGRGDEEARRGLLLRRLLSLMDRFNEHISVTEGPDGLFGDVLAKAPRLERAVWEMRCDHDGIHVSISRLLSAVADRAVSLERIRQEAATLLAKIAEHRQRGTDLVHEAYERDIGAQD